MRYRDLDLIINAGAPGSYPVFAIGPGARRAAGTLRLDPAAPDFQAALQGLEARRTDAGFLRQFGEELFHRLFDGAVGALFQACYEEIRPQSDLGLRLRLSVTPPELAALPWEFLYHPRERAFLATLVQCPLVRFLQDERRGRSLEASLPLRMLVCISTLPPPYVPLDVEREKADLHQALDGLEGERVQLRFLEGAVTEQALADALAEDHDLFHFMGHGDFVDGQGALMLDDGHGAAKALDDSGVADLFRNAVSIKLAFINACKGATRSGTSLMAGLGPTLVSVGVPAVVAMQYSIRDDAALAFSRDFYSHLFRGAHRGLVDHAASHARSRLARRFAGDRDLAAPVVFMRAESGLVFTLPETDSVMRGLLAPQNLDRLAVEASVLASQARELDQGDPRRETITRRQRDAERRIRRLRRAGISAVLGLGIAFVAVWGAALDRLDLSLERYTLWLGRSLVTPELDDGLRFVTVSGELEERFGAHLGPPWRERHATLVDRLAAAGARAVVFDMHFHDPDSRDAVFAGAVEAAALRQPPMPVVLGYTEMLRNVPHVPAALVLAGARFAISCYSRAAGAEYARSVPLVVFKRGGVVWPALAVAAFSAYTGLSLSGGEAGFGDQRRLLLRDAQRAVSLPYSFEAQGSEDNSCSAIAPGDRTAELLLRHPALEALRAPDRVAGYGQVLDAPAAELEAKFEGRLVIVGGAVDRDDFRIVEPGADPRFGYELHAAAINELLMARALARAPRAWQLAVMVLMALAGAAAAMAGGMQHPWRGRALLAVSAGLYLALALGVLATTLLMLDAAYHLGAMLAAWWFARRGVRRATHGRLEAALIPARMVPS